MVDRRRVRATLCIALIGGGAWLANRQVPPGFLAYESAQRSLLPPSAVVDQPRAENIATIFIIGCDARVNVDTSDSIDRDPSSFRLTINMSIMLVAWR